MNVFLDANILFSAAQSHSRMRLFLDVLLEKADCLTNEYAVEEARRNLAAKFPDGVKALERLVKQCGIILQMATDLEVELPLKDRPILGGAIAGHATHLLTGDERDFGKLWGKTIQGVKIVSPIRWPCRVVWRWYTTGFFAVEDKRVAISEQTI